MSAEGVGQQHCDFCGYPIFWDGVGRANKKGVYRWLHDACTKKALRARLPR